MPEYAHPEALATTAWVADHLSDPGVRIVESDEDYLLYDISHIPGAVKVDWFTSLQDPVRRDFLSKTAFESLCARMGIANDTTVVFYGDKNNWFACYSFWLFTYYGHTSLKIMNGGRVLWERESRPMARDLPSYAHTRYSARQPDPGIRAFRDQVLEHIQAGRPLIDVRSPQEYSGELIAMPNYPQEGAQRGGHIPTAINIPWNQAVAEGSSKFKEAGELQELYRLNGVAPDSETIAYCRIGERSAHTWFVLKYLLGYAHVRNYDGSWTEWGNLVNAPIEKGASAG